MWAVWRCGLFCHFAAVSLPNPGFYPCPARSWRECPRDGHSHIMLDPSESATDRMQMGLANEQGKFLSFISQALVESDSHQTRRPIPPRHSPQSPRRNVPLPDHRVSYEQKLKNPKQTRSPVRSTGPGTRYEKSVMSFLTGNQPEPIYCHWDQGFGVRGHGDARHDANVKIISQEERQDWSMHN